MIDMDGKETERYTVLLVDDEEDVVRIIQDKTDWDSLGFRVIGYAHNGVEALELAEEHQPDVVMTDIKMPFMDGLTLSRKLKELYPDCRVVIFSGFDEFEYAKEAIQLEVEQYLLKPVDPSELREVFGRLKTNLDKERANRQNIDRLRENYLQSLPLLQEVFFTSLIEGRIPDERIGQYLTSYQIELTGPFYLITILHISGQEQISNMDAVLKTVSLRNLLEDWLKNRYRGRSLNYLGNVVLISELSSEEELMPFTDAMDVFCRTIKRTADITVTAGIGQVCRELSDIRLSYQGASHAVSYRALYGNTRAINIVEIDPQSKEEHAWERESAEKIMKQLRLGNQEALDQEIDTCMERFRQGGSTLQRYQIFVLSLCAQIAELGAGNHMDLETALGGNLGLYEKIFQSDSPQEMGEWLKDVCRHIQKLYLKRREASATSFVEHALEYVEKQYANTEVSIETVCKELGVSAAYFSTVFKKETGKTFISYLTEYRMEKAVELLMTTADRTYLIAEKVGYTDSNYFSYVFKKQFGISPSKYRTERLKENGG